MRAERLSLAERPTSAPDAPDTRDTALLVANEAVAPRSAPRRRVLHRGAVRILARFIDGGILALMVLSLAAAGGVDVLHLPLVEALPFVLLPPAAVALVWLAGGYRFAYAESIAGRLLRVLAGGICAVSFVALSGLTLASSHIWLLAQVAAVCVLVQFALHAAYQTAMRTLTRAGAFSDNVIIIGATPAASRIVERNAREHEMNILGYFDDRAGRTPAQMGEAPFLGAIDDLLAWPRLPEVDRIVVTVTSTAQKRVRGLIDRLRRLPQEIILVIDLDGFNPEHTSLARIVDAPAAYVSGAPRDMRRAAMKRTLDLAVALVCCVVFLIPVIVIAILVKLDSPGPVLFRQKRHGFNNQIIRVWKFRTMRPDAAAEHGHIIQTMPNDPRVTRIGRVLRATSLDELPQLLNVLAGEMSIVGPRPHAVGMTAGATEVVRLVGDYAHRHRMKPGITGWAQVNGSRGPVHTAEEVRERVRLDMEYVSRASIWLDLWILVLTLPRLFGDRDRSR